MRILLTTPYFHPSVGGVETMALTLAVAFCEHGHEVVVATMTPHLSADSFPFRVVRNPSARQLWTLSASADVILQNHISLRLGWAGLVQRRPTLIAHHMWTPQSGAGGWRGKLKHGIARLCRNVGVSSAIVQTLPRPATVIPNPYRDDLFRRHADIPKDREIVYLGRLVEGKGVHRAIEMIDHLKRRGHSWRLSVIGEGPAEASLRQRAQELNVSDQVEFVGVLRDDALVRCLNRHQILVVPSIWEEPFGLVALEGMACGLVVIGTDVGGLPEAIGQAGLIVPPNDVPAMASAVEHVMTNPEAIPHFAELAEPHLLAHRRATIASRYLVELDACRNPHE